MASAAVNEAADGETRPEVFRRVCRFCGEGHH